MAFDAHRGRASGLFALFLLGFTSLVVQTVLARESLFAFHGGEIGLGLFYAVWLGSIAAGATAGARWVRRARRRGARTARLEGDEVRTGFSRDHGVAFSTASSRMAVLAGLTLLAWIGLAGLGLFRHHHPFLPVAAGAYLSAGAYLVLLLAAVLPSGAVTGFLFPLALENGRIKPGSGYAIESFGSMAGGAFASLVALPRVSAIELLAGAGLATLPLWISAVRTGWAEARAPEEDLGAAHEAAQSVPQGARPTARVLLLTGLPLAGLAVLFFSGLAARLDHAWMQARWRGLGTGTETLADLATPYHQITLATRQGEVSLYLDGLYQAGMSDPYVDSLAAAVIATQHPAPRRMLVLAPGLIGPARALAAARGVALTLVRNDAALDRAAAAAQANGAFRPPALDAAAQPEVRTADPRAFVLAQERAGGTYDLIAVLAAAPSGGSGNRLYTREFFAACAAILSPGGTLALSLPGTANVASPEGALTRAAVFVALVEVFEEVRITPGTVHQLFAARPRTDAALPRPGSRTAQASMAGSGVAREAESPLCWEPDSLAARRARLWPSSRPWPPALFAAELPRERRETLRASLEDLLAAGVPANRDARPFVYYEEIRRWDRFSGSRLAPLLDAWHRHPWPLGLAFLGVLAVPALWLRRREGPAAVSLASSGMAGMGASLILLLLYQTFRGTLYLEIGLIVALTMAGLGLGAWWGERARRWGDRRYAILVVDLLWAAFLPAWIPLIGVLSSSGPRRAAMLLFALAVSAGILTSLSFAWVAGRLERRDSRGPSVAGGLADAADQAGAVWGAFATGIFLVPLLGFAGGLVILAGAKLLSALGWVLPGARSH